MATVQSLYDELSKQYVGVTMEQIGDSYKIICNNEFTLYVPENFSDLTEAYAFFQGAGGGEGEAPAGGGQGSAAADQGHAAHGDSHRTPGRRGGRRVPGKNTGGLP